MNYLPPRRSQVLSETITSDIIIVILFFLFLLSGCQGNSKDNACKLDINCPKDKICAQKGPVAGTCVESVRRLPSVLMGIFVIMNTGV
ncbi:MAG: hypothetical protein GXP49_13690 [Deltaproteobacteria bacterium]|nr:hypothetical protein [Deltaproteobacteria bacterium]